MFLESTPNPKKSRKFLVAFLLEQMYRSSRQVANRKDLVQQTVSVLTNVETGEFLVFLTIPLGSESITTFVHRGDDPIAVHREARKLWSSLNTHNRTRRTFFATVLDEQRAVIGPEFQAKIPQEAFAAAELLLPEVQGPRS